LAEELSCAKAQTLFSLRATEQELSKRRLSWVNGGSTLASKKQALVAALEMEKKTEGLSKDHHKSGGISTDTNDDSLYGAGAKSKVMAITQGELSAPFKEFESTITALHASEEGSPQGLLTVALLGINKTPPITLVVKMVLTKKLKSPVISTALDKVLEAVPHMGVYLGWMLLQVNGQVYEDLLSWSVSPKFASALVSGQWSFSDFNVPREITRMQYRNQEMIMPDDLDDWGRDRSQWFMDTEDISNARRVPGKVALRNGAIRGMGEQRQVTRQLYVPVCYSGVLHAQVC
jgi:hypothetical protein